MTFINGRHEPDAATLDHLHRRSQRAGRSLPSVVLACRQCNNARGEPPAVNVKCPVLAMLKGERRAA
jgi:5-methylcytosine-specific restriction endonuclease McrA